MIDDSINVIFERIKEVLNRYGGDETLVLREEYLGSTAREQKPALHLYGRRSVSIAGRKPQSTYVAGVVRQKAYAGFYHMPVYSHPAEFSLSEALEKTRKGKSCLHIKTADPELLKELDAITAAGIELYKDLGWI